MKVSFLLLEFFALILATLADRHPYYEDYEDRVDVQEEPEPDQCDKLIGKYVDGKFVGSQVDYDLEKILEMYGGPPGKLNASWTEKDEAPIKYYEDPKERPLIDVDQRYWIYKYGDSDYRTYVRTEHAVYRFKNTPREFVDIRGDIYFTPRDFCGMSRKAHYFLDDRGFTFDVSHEYCRITERHLSCSSPSRWITDSDGSLRPSPPTTTPAPALLAALVGGGK